MLLVVILSGLVAGIIATAIMSVPQYFFWRRWGTIGILEWHENQMILSRLFHKDPDDVLLPSFSLHFLNGALAAVGYSLTIFFFPILKILSVLLLGALFGIVLWLLTLALIHKSITGVSILRHPLKTSPIILSIMLHILYGIIVAVCIQLMI
ncbi:MAG: hypothetical protein ABDH32_05875 [Candidatus Caldarchaeales archaeon]